MTAQQRIPGCPPTTPPAPNPPEAAAPAAFGQTRLITTPDDKQVYTANRETDAHTALTRGLAEYMAEQTIGFGGTDYRFNYVMDHWADPEQKADYPAAAVYSTGEGTYDPSKFVPNARSSQRIALPDGSYLANESELIMEMKLELWANDVEERMALCAMIEDAMVPVEWRSGPLLELPHYFNERAGYAKVSVMYDDGDEQAVRRYRLAVFTIRGIVPVDRLFAFPDARTRLKVEVT